MAIKQNGEKKRNVDEQGAKRHDAQKLCGEDLLLGREIADQQPHNGGGQGVGNNTARYAEQGIDEGSGHG
ncbi:MAG: hypothetical protein DDT34_01691 [Firmicutes bacterium]|nr:hypothetical protein [Bacillota bacterium]